MVLGTRTSLIAADILVVVFTWHKTFMVRRQAARIGLQTPVYSLILRDGLSIYTEPDTNDGDLFDLLGQERRISCQRFKTHKKLCHYSSVLFLVHFSS